MFSAEGLWGTISNASFGERAAAVACRSLGFTEGASRDWVFSLGVANPAYQNDALRFSTAEPMLVCSVSCRGDEAGLEACSIAWCDEGEPCGGGAAGVRCN